RSSITPVRSPTLAEFDRPSSRSELVALADSISRANARRRVSNRARGHRHGGYRERFPRSVAFRLQPAPRIQDLLAPRGFAIRSLRAPQWVRRGSPTRIGSLLPASAP